MCGVQLASFLQGRGIPAMCYHAGMSATQRQAVSSALAARRLRVVTCTTALSTGLDLSFIDGVVHHSLPPSMEDFVQQVRPALASHLPPPLRTRGALASRRAGADRTRRT